MMEATVIATKNMLVALGATLEPITEKNKRVREKISIKLGTQPSGNTLLFQLNR